MTATTTPISLEHVVCAEAEEALLGAWMLGPNTAIHSAHDMQESDFTDPRRRDIFNAIKRLIDVGVAPDPVAVRGELIRVGAVAATGSQNVGVLLHRMLEAVPVPASAATYKLIVLEHSLRRCAVNAADRVRQAATGDSLPAFGATFTVESQAVLDAWQRCQKAWGDRLAQ